MNANFKAIGGKPWGVTDDAFIFKGQRIPFEDLSFCRLVSTPTTALTNGIAQANWNGKELVLAFKYSDKALAHRAINYISDKIDEAHGKTNDYVYKLTAHTGTTLEVYDTYLVINHMRVGSLTTNILRGGAVGGKRINFSDITSLQFREPAGMTVGFIQVAYPGSIESKKGIVDMINDENSVPIQPAMVDQAREIVQYIESRRQELRASNGTVIQQLSVADEIKKFKELLDLGIITEEEFSAKKKELLGI